MPPADVLVIGGGPAGLSAALTLVRQNHSVAVFDNGRSRALPSLKIHGVSTFDGMPPAEYFAAARAELARYPDFQSVDAEIVELRKLDNATFEARDGQGKTYQGKKVILANGVKDCFPDIEGYAAAWGKGIFHNPFAQGRLNDANNSRSGVLAVDWIAMPKFAMHLTHLLSQLTPEVTIYTHGNKDLAADLQARLAQSVGKASKVNVDNRRITRLELKSPQESTMQIHFDDETSTTECFLGHAAITTLNGSFAEQLGIDVSQSKAEYVVNGPTNMTNVEGVYAAGDATSMFKVWPNAVASGAVTAAGVAVRLQEEKWGLESIFG